MLNDIGRYNPNELNYIIDCKSEEESIAIGRAIRAIDTLKSENVALSAEVERLTTEFADSQRREKAAEEVLDGICEVCGWEVGSEECIGCAIDS